MIGPEVVPAEFLQLAGHPVRWRLLTELGRGDRTVHELTGLVGEPQNLVSYHLGKLRQARLVRSRRSSADRRGAYYALDLGRARALLTATGVALHPGLRLVPPPAPADPVGAAAPVARVLFLCTGNSARSQMAEALARVRSGGRVEARSAGTRPKPLHPLAVQVMRDDHGIDLSGGRPTHVDELAGRRFDRVVTLCDRVREACPELPTGAEATHWSIPDPSAGEADLAAFRATAAELEERVGFLLAGLAAGPAHPPSQEDR